MKQNFIGVKCPDVQRRRVGRKASARKGNTFYGCWQLSEVQVHFSAQAYSGKMSECGSEYLVEKNLKAGPVIACPNKECDYERAAPPPPEPPPRVHTAPVLSIQQ